MPDRTLLAGIFESIQSLSGGVGTAGTVGVAVGSGVGVLVGVGAIHPPSVTVGPGRLAPLWAE